MGLKLGSMTFGGLFKKPETVLYPFETKAAPAGRKGMVRNEVESCILCGICQKKCPCQTIVVDKPNRTWKINHYQCIQCGYCVRECPKKCLVMDPTIPSTVTSFDFEVFEVPEQQKKPKATPAAETAPATESTGDPEMDAKLAKMDPEKAAKVRAAFMAKKAKEESAPAVESTGDPEMDAKLAKMDPEKAAKVRAAFMAKKAKEAAAAEQAE